MNSRTIGPVLMIAFGTVAMTSPLVGGTTTAGVQTPTTQCVTDAALAPVDPCAPCDTTPLVFGVVNPCVVDTTPTTVATTTGADSVDTTPTTIQATTSTAAETGPQLPATGHDSTPLAVGGGALLVLGGGVILAARRRPAPR